MASASYDGTLKLWDLAAAARASNGSKRVGAGRTGGGGSKQEGQRHFGIRNGGWEEAGESGEGSGESGSWWWRQCTTDIRPMLRT